MGEKYPQTRALKSHSAPCRVLVGRGRLLFSLSKVVLLVSPQILYKYINMHKNYTQQFEGVGLLSQMTPVASLSGELILAGRRRWSLASPRKTNRPRRLP